MQELITIITITFYLLINLLLLVKSIEISILYLKHAKNNI